MGKVKCDLCHGEHHFSEHLPRVIYNQLSKGDVVFVRAIVEKVEEHAQDTAIFVRETEPGYPQKYFWKARVNSVDVFPCKGVNKKDV